MIGICVKVCSKLCRHREERKKGGKRRQDRTDVYRAGVGEEGARKDQGVEGERKEGGEGGGCYKASRSSSIGMCEL